MRSRPFLRKIIILLIVIISIASVIVFMNRRNQKTDVCKTHDYGLHPASNATLLDQNCIHNEGSEFSGTADIKARATSFWASPDDPEKVASWYIQTFSKDYYLTRRTPDVTPGEISLVGLMPHSTRGVNVRIRSDHLAETKGNEPPAKTVGPQGTKSYITVDTNL